MKRASFKDLIIFEDEEYLLINKPPYISTLEDRDATKTNILEMAREIYPDIKVCHRLDKETSGVLALAKTPEAYRHLSIQFEDRNVTKQYHAVVDGVHEFEGVDVYLPIYASSDGIVKIDKQKGKIAETIFNTIEVFKKHTLVACYPITGRMHQIRIHLTCLKAPITCDGQYGGKPLYLSSLKKNFNLKQDTEEMPLIQRVALHARSLEFKNSEEKTIFAEAPYPKDFEVLVKQLKKYS
ncbi:pseudouridylate synthase [Sporocytophaga myxococcoides]|uniref:Pseudouridylate synthase n=1 Tax=Sporocytophaga myxococcoides TaxID=153721 RepID=A0A098L950_9BACT|nr:RluA family pseudouridine synthase [Sporocytophaga myxococcoides]GAL82869.1 pseudouridylate synthase [Sporocytophaga myxococcoides]